MISTFRITIRGITSNSICNYGKHIPLAFKESKKLNKMISKDSSKKTYRPNQMVSKKAILSSAYDNEGTSRRLTALNKIYMEEITMMLNGGEYKNQLAELGIEITKVRMAEGLNFLNIYWFSQRCNVDEEEIIFILSKALGELQQEMGSVRYTSKVPYLRFVRDLRLERENHLDQIFRSADFGKDFEPTYQSKVITPDFIQKPYEFPEMRQDVLGLDYLKIRRNIEDRLMKFKAVNIEWIDEKKEEELREEQTKVPEKLVVFSKKEFYKFYKRRRILEIKMKKHQSREQFAFEDFRDDEFEPPQQDDRQYDHLYDDDYDDDDDDGNDDDYPPER